MSPVGKPILPQATILCIFESKLNWMNFVVVDFPLVPVTPIFKFFFLKISISSRSDIIITLFFFACLMIGLTSLSL